MANYLLQLSYGPETCAALVNNPQGCGEAVRAAIENLGGKLEHVWLAFGRRHVSIVNMPDNVAVSALPTEFSAGGASQNARTTPLMSFQERL